MTDRIGALERLAKLKADGVLTDAEFTAHKSALLSLPASATTASKRATAKELFVQGHEKSRGVRHFFRWFWGIQLVAIVLVGIYFFYRGAILEQARHPSPVRAPAPQGAQPMPTSAQQTQPALNQLDNPRRKLTAREFHDLPYEALPGYPSTAPDAVAARVRRAWPQGYMPTDKECAKQPDGALANNGELDDYMNPCMSYN